MNNNNFTEKKAFSAVSSSQTLHQAAPQRRLCRCCLLPGIKLGLLEVDGPDFGLLLVDVILRSRET